MVSVTKRISNVEQPRGGYVNPRTFDVVELQDEAILNKKENIHAILVGLVVDYLTRFINGADKNNVFNVSLAGASIIKKESLAWKFFENILGIDEESIINTCKIVGFDVVYRSGVKGYKPVELINPDRETIENIKIMVQRSLNFTKVYGPIIKEGFTFEGGYTDVVSSGDGDFLTKDTLWDFKVSKSNPTSKQTLQLLMYYLMGTNSVHSEFQAIENLGIFNPRLSKIYTLSIDKIPKEVINDVRANVIGYESVDEQVKMVVEKYIIKGKAFDFSEVSSQEELEDIKEGFRKLEQLTEEEKAKVINDISKGIV